MFEINHQIQSALGIINTRHFHGLDIIFVTGNVDEPAFRIDHVFQFGIGIVLGNVLFDAVIDDMPINFIRLGNDCL